MRRRDIFLFLTGAVIWPKRVRALQSSSKLWRVALLYPGTIGDAERPIWEAFLNELESLGHIEGKDFVLHRREANGRYERGPALSDELIALRPDVIVVVSALAIAAMQHATTTIPIVMWGVVDPVGLGFVSSLAHPGGNITGTTTASDDAVGKAVELLHLLVPETHRVAVLMSSNPTHPLHLALVKKAAEAMGLIVVPILAPTPADLDRAFAEIVAKECEALFVLIEYQCRLALFHHPHRRRAAGVGSADEPYLARFPRKSMACEPRLILASRCAPGLPHHVSSASATDSGGPGGDALVGVR